MGSRLGKLSAGPLLVPALEQLMFGVERAVSASAGFPSDSSASAVRICRPVELRGRSTSVCAKDWRKRQRHEGAIRLRDSAGFLVTVLFTGSIVLVL